MQFIFFFYQDFFFTDTDDLRETRGKEEIIFIPLHHLHPLTNILTFTFNFACGMTTTYF